MYYKNKHYVVKTYNELTKEEQEKVLQKELENESNYYWYSEDRYELFKEEIENLKKELKKYTSITIELAEPNIECGSSYMYLEREQPLKIYMKRNDYDIYLNDFTFETNYNGIIDLKEFYFYKSDTYYSYGDAFYTDNFKSIRQYLSPHEYRDVIGAIKTYIEYVNNAYSLVDEYSSSYHEDFKEYVEEDLIINEREFEFYINEETTEYINAWGGENMKKKLMKFLEALDEYGEYFFSYGSIKKDYEFVSGILEAQGYWSGTSYRLFFDDNMNLINVEERW